MSNLKDRLIRDLLISPDIWKPAESVTQATEILHRIVTKALENE
jgi:hypothetical protein